MIRSRLPSVVIGVALALGPNAASALERLVFAVPGGSPELIERLRIASLLEATVEAGTPGSDQVFAAALADYERMVGALYAEGHYGGTVNILIDGREAASIAPFSIPEQISVVRVEVRPGPIYRFNTAQIAPLAPETELPEGFVRGAPARVGVIRDATQVAVEGWRDVGHAKASVADQAITVVHPALALNAQIRLAPDRALTFGELEIIGNEKVDEARIRRIAGLIPGSQFSPAEAERVANRLRRTGAFRSVVLREAETASPEGRLDMIAEVSEAIPRRFGFGAELSTTDGLTLSGFWLHRNWLGGAERLRFDAEIAGIGGDTGGIDYSTGVTFQRAATFGIDNDLILSAEVEQFNEPEFTTHSLSLGAELRRRASDELTLATGIRFDFSAVNDASGEEEYSQLFFPLGATLDKRENPLNTDDGYYVDLEIAPFLGLGGSEDGLRMTLDARAYEDFGPDNRFVLAARVQAGSILGASITGLPNDERFYSGGGGTVRGQDYQSLDIDLGGGLRSGGRSFLGLQAELRTSVGDDFEIVGFADWGQIGPDSIPGVDGESHAGAGLGLRYDTGIGPLRVDVAVPVSGPEVGTSYHLYIGIGQAF